MYVLSVSQKSENVNTYEEFFVGAYLLRQKGGNYVNTTFGKNH